MTKKFKFIQQWKDFFTYLSEKEKEIHEYFYKFFDFIRDPAKFKELLQIHQSVLLQL